MARLQDGGFIVLNICNCLKGVRQRFRLCPVNFFLLLSVLWLWLIGVPGTVSAQVVDIPDPGLRAAIAEALRNAPGDTITRADMETLGELEAGGRGITDLRGIEFAINLTALNLGSNSITDISPLASLTNLTALDLKGNNISDIFALIPLANLTWLDLGHNNISDIFALIPLTNLRRLDLGHNNISDVETLERLMAQGTVVYFRGNPAFETPGPKIEDGWVGLVVPATNVRSGSQAAGSGRDFLSEASGRTVTEAHVAVNGARAGTRVGDSVWTAGRLDATDPNNLNTAVGYLGLTNIRYPVAYGVVPIRSETQQETRVYIGAGPVKVWLNGTLVYRDTRHWSGDNYETAVPVLLTPGENLLFVAAYRPYPWTSRWGAFFGFQDGTVYTVGAAGADPLDVNRDGQVTVIDLAIVALFYGTRLPAGFSFPADVNADGVVNILDLTAVAQGIDTTSGGPNQVSLEDVKAAVAAAAEQAGELEGVAAAPIHFSVRREGRSHGTLAYLNVADALADARHPAVSDVLEKFLELLAETQVIPETSALLPNYPNPFNPETWIPYHLAKAADVTVTIYDVRGSVVRELALGHQPTGVYVSRGRAAYWDGKNNYGEKVASGLYFYTLTAGKFTATRKLLIAK